MESFQQQNVESVDNRLPNVITIFIITELLRVLSKQGLYIVDGRYDAEFGKFYEQIVRKR